RSQQSGILGHVVGLDPQIFSPLGNHFTPFIADNHGACCRPGIATGAAVNVGADGEWPVRLRRFSKKRSLLHAPSASRAASRSGKPAAKIFFCAPAMS